MSAMVPALTLHGMWPSFAKPDSPSSSSASSSDDDKDPAAAAAADVDVDAAAVARHRRALRDVSGLITRRRSDASTARGACFWPQDCTKPEWWPKSSPWAYDPSLLPTGPEYETLAPAWYSDG